MSDTMQEFPRLRRLSIRAMMFKAKQIAEPIRLSKFINNQLNQCELNDFVKDFQELQKLKFEKIDNHWYVRKPSLQKDYNVNKNEV